MSDIETKPDPTTAAENTEAPVAERPAEKTGEEEKSATETATDAALAAASKTTDSVFSMFGGGPKKEKKEDAEEVDEPSGSSKAQKGEEDVSILPAVSVSLFVLCETAQHFKISSAG
jgi:Ran-binding protein 1